jgi:MFS family permease
LEADASDSTNETGAIAAMADIRTTSATLASDAVAKRNALLLSIAQAFYGIAVSTIIMVGGIVGLTLAPDKSLATLPITTFVFGTFVSTVPASLFMQRYGRRPGFLLGSALGLAGMLVAAEAIRLGDFWLFCFATHLCGYYMASAQYYRFAATDTASAEFRPRAISWVLAGGLAAALVAPEIVTRTKDWMSPFVFSGCFLASALCVVAAALALLFIDIPRPPRGEGSRSTGRPLLEILKQPKLIAAIIAGTVSYGMMNLVMTAAPVAMEMCGYTVDQSSNSIRWHVVAMYLPSFFTGPLIARIGRLPVLMLGLGLLAACGVVALMGIEVMNFTIALVLVGAGWNFGYISATALVTDCHTPEERGKVQAANDLIIFGFVALCSLLSGVLLNVVGWSGVNLVIFPLVAIAVILIIIMPRLERSAAPGAA